MTVHNSGSAVLTFGSWTVTDSKQTDTGTLNNFLVGAYQNQSFTISTSGLDCSTECAVSVYTSNGEGVTRDWVGLAPFNSYNLAMQVKATDSNGDCGSSQCITATSVNETVTVSNVNATLASIKILTYYIIDSSGNECSQNSQSIVLGIPSATNVIFTLNGCSWYGSSFTFQSGYTYLLKVVTSDNQNFQTQVVK